MAQRAIVDCDRCGMSNIRGASTIEAVVGGKEDQPQTQLFASVDLCPRCAQAMLQSAVNALDPQAARLWIADAKKRVKKG